MPLTVRLDPPLINYLDILAARRGATRSDVVREAITRLYEQEGGAEGRSFHEEIAPLIGVVNGGGVALSERTGEKFRRVLEDRRAGRVR